MENDKIMQKAQAIHNNIVDLAQYKKLANSNERIAKKCKKPPFLEIMGQNGQCWTVFGQNGRNEMFFKKALGKFFPPF